MATSDAPRRPPGRPTERRRAPDHSPDPDQSPDPATSAVRGGGPGDDAARARQFRRFGIALAAAALVLLALVAIRRDDDGGQDDAGQRRAVSTEPGGPSTTATPATTTTLPLVVDANTPLVTAPIPTTTTATAPTPERPLKILVAGDSLVGWVPAAFEAAMAGRPVEVIDKWKGSSGLVRPDYYDWPATLASLMKEYEPDVVVLGFGGNDAQAIQVDGKILRLDDPEWSAEYRRRVDQVLDAVAHPGRTLWWIGLPISERENIEKIRPTINAAVVTGVNSHPWARYVDPGPILTPDGTYQVNLPGPDGTPERVRADDGIHLSPAGGRRVVDSFLPALEAERGLT